MFSHFLFLFLPLLQAPDYHLRILSDLLTEKAIMDLYHPLKPLQDR